MQLTLFSQSAAGRCVPCRKRIPRLSAKTVLIMKLTAFLITIAFLQVHAAGHAQTVTLSRQHSSLENIFKEIRKQTGYYFLYPDEQLSGAEKVSLDVKNAPLQQVLDLCFRDQPLTYTIDNKIVIVQRRPV